MAAEQIVFFRKSSCDFSYPSVSATASEASDLAENVLNRSNLSAWITTDSTDASLTTLTIDMSDERQITDILLLKHNFKNFTVKYWDGSAYQAFSPAISETTCTDENSYYQVTSQTTTKIQITINGTQTPNEDKYLYQFIATKRIGQLDGWPVIKSPTHSRNKQKIKMLSGKLSVVENVGNFSCQLKAKSITSDADLTIIETLYSLSDGFLMWLCGSSESQFRTIRQGYRLEDIYLMKCVDDYQPEYVSGIYKYGIVLDIALQEVVE